MKLSKTRFSLCFVFQMEDIVIPMSRGNMEDIEQDGNAAENSFQPGDESAAEGSQNANSSTQVIYERESRSVLLPVVELAR